MALVLGCAWLYLVYAPRKYQSSAQYLVRLGHESVSLDPVATVGETMGLYMTSDSIVRSTREIISSGTLAEKVVKRVGAQTILLSSASKIPLVEPIKQYWRSIDPIADEERARITLLQHLDVRSPNQSNVIAVSYESPNAEASHKVMQAVSEVFLEEHSRINRTEGSLDFFVEQDKFLSKELHNATEELKEAKQRNQISSIDGKRQSLETRLTETHSQLFNNQREMASSNSRIEQLTAQLKSTPVDMIINAKNGMDQQTTAAMRQQLYDLQIKEKELQSRLSSDHPALLNVQKQLKEAEAIFSASNRTDVETSRGANPVHQQLTLELLKEKANNVSLVAAADVLNKQLNDLHQELATLGEQEQEIFHLQTQLEVVKAKYESHAEKLEQARLEHELGSKAITSIGVIESPRINQRPSSPNKVLTIALGVLAALFVGLTLPFAIEYLRDDTHDLAIQGPAVESHAGVVNLPGFRDKLESAGAS